MINQLRAMSIIEAVTYLALVAATVYKYVDGNDQGVAVLGPVHGVLFLIFAALLLRHHRSLGWPLWRAIMAMVIGSLPFGGFWVERNWLAPLVVRPGPATSGPRP